MGEQDNLGRLTPLGKDLVYKDLEGADFILRRELKDPKIWQDMAAANRYLTFEHTDWHVSTLSEKDGLHAVIVSEDNKVIDDAGRIKVGDSRNPEPPLPMPPPPMAVPPYEAMPNVQIQPSINDPRWLNPSEDLHVQKLASDLVRCDNSNARVVLKEIEHDKHIPIEMQAANNLADTEARQYGLPGSPEHVYRTAFGQYEIIDRYGNPIPPPTFVQPERFPVPHSSYVPNPYYSQPTYYFSRSQSPSDPIGNSYFNEGNSYCYDAQPLYPASNYSSINLGNGLSAAWSGSTFALSIPLGNNHYYRPRHR